MKYLVLALLSCSSCATAPKMDCDQVHNRDLKIECAHRNMCSEGARGTDRDPNVCFPEPWKTWMRNGNTN